MKRDNYTVGIPTKAKKQKNKRTIFKRTRTILTIIAFFLGTWFAFLQLSGINIKPFQSDTFASVLLDVTILIYFLAWINGLLMDLKDEETIFILSPNNDKLKLSAFGIIMSLAILFFCLCYFKSYKEFILLLDAFYIFNILSWIYLIKFIENAVIENQEFYKNEHKYFKIIYMQLLIDDYLKGKWQYYRFIAGSAILIIVNLLIFTNLSTIFARLIKSESVELVKSLGFFIFIFVTEGWIWYMRLKRSACIELLDNMDEEYYLQERRK